jgi:ABC-type multidrug transport system fused ATPase/permease subunit
VRTAAPRLSRATIARREVAEIVWRERGVLLVAVLSALVGPVSAMAVPVAAKLVIDEVIGRGRTGLLPPIAIGAGLGVVLQAATAYGLAHAGAVAGERAVARLRQRLYRHALALPVGYFDATPTGTLVSRCMADVDQVRALFGSGLLQLVTGTLSAVIAVAVLVSLDSQLTGLVLAALVIVALGLARGFNGLHPAFRSVNDLQAALGARLTEVFGGIRIVKVSGAERREALAFTRESHRLVRASVGAQRRVAFLGAAIALASGVVSVGLLVLGGAAVARGSMTLGDLALFVFLVGLLGAPLVQVAAVGGEVSRALAALTRIGELRGTSTEDDEDRTARSLDRPRGDVVFDSVSFRYPTGRSALDGVCFHAPRGSLTALVGPNGSGKTTIAKLVLGFHRPTAGVVTIDGVDLASVRRRAYRAYVAVVPQEPFLFDGTVADNIRYARPAATDSEFRRALRLSNCDQLASALPAGFDTRVGERGVLLSGGQRQRIALGRAFLTDPRILIVDEGTTHLDAESEACIQEALRELRQGRTTFVIVHGSAGVWDVDQVVVLEGGRVIGTEQPREPTRTSCASMAWGPC